jgi:osmoprotectant transport system substrate-binding protein
MRFFRSSRTHFVIVPALIAVFVLSACGTAGNTGNTNNTGNTPKGPIIVASKLDVESQLLTKMYTLLLKKAGFTVTEKPALGNSTFISQAIKSGQIDLYPEFTATGLNQLNITSANDPQKDYQAVKNAYNMQFQITWLDASPLNDGYAICTSQDQSQKLGITKISDLSTKASNLVLTLPSDGVSFIDGLKSAYNLTTQSFKKVTTVDYALGFQAVKSDQSQLTVCYTTDGSVKTSNFIFLNDDKHGFPEFNPAPIVRNPILHKYPEIAATLNPLAPKLTTDVSIQLQGQVADKKKANEPVAQAVTEVATSFLQSQGLL